jgi:peptide/nickel transport system substrate-binding protein
MRSRAAIVLAIAAGLALACGAPQPGPTGVQDGAGYGGRFVFPLRFEPKTLNFASVAEVYGVLVLRLVGDSLIDHDARLQVVPRLARSWEFSADGRRLTFHLRPGVHFHDGVPLTSADVVYTYERVMDPESLAIIWMDSFLPIERVEAPDAATVVVTYRAPYVPAIHGWNVPILPRHLYEKEDFATSRFNRAPVGTGPFRFGSWEPGRRIVLHANPDYWAGRPYLDTFVFQVIPSQETTLQALLAAEVDFATLTPVQWEAHAGSAAFARRFRSLSYVPLFYYYIAWRGDGSNPFFAEPAVRRALSLALDRHGYVNRVLRGNGRVASSLFHPVVGGADPAAPDEPYDPRAAAALLDDAGWRVRPETGVRERGGIPFRFTLLVFSGGEDHLMFAQVAQESLRRIGVEMAIERLDWATLSGRLRSGEFQAALSGAAPGLDPDGVFALVHSSQIAGGRNYAGFRDTQIDAWLEEGRRTTDAGARADLYIRIDRRLRELQPYAPLFFPVLQVACSRRFRAVETAPGGILDHFPGAAAIALDDGA